MHTTYPLELAATHRACFMEALGHDAALLFASPGAIRNGDAEHRYRQDSDVLYLSGWEDPECVLLFRPGAEQPFVMFVQPKDPEREVWTGRRPGPEGAKDQYGADEAFPIEELGKRLPDLLQGYRNLHYRFAQDFDRDRMLVGAIAQARRKAKNAGLDVPDAFFDPARLLHELRLLKSPEEIAILRRAAAITDQAHRAAMAQTAPGVYEYELEALIDGHFRASGGAGPGYGTIVGGGDNATVLHYVTNHAPLGDGDLVCVDAGCEFQGYTADVTRTWPVNGVFSAAQRRLYSLVLRAELEAIEQVRVGRSWKDMHDTATRVLTEGMVELGLLPAWTEEAEYPRDQHIDRLIEDEVHKRYYMHGTGHWLGLDVHDVGVYVAGGQARPFEPGMVITVEPGLYIPASDEDAPAEYRGVGIRIEDDVLVTPDGPEVLTAAIPKTLDQVEAAVAAALD